MYELRGTEPSNEKDDRNRRILRLGTNLHEFVQGAYTAQSGASGIYHEVEVSLPDLGVYGHADTLLEYEDGHWELMEWKSIGVKGLEWGLKKGDLPKPEHIKQAQTYAYGLRQFGGWTGTEEVLCSKDSCDDPFGFGFGGTHGGHIPPLGDRLTAVTIAYFSRDDLRIEEFPLTPDPSWGLELSDFIARLNKYRADDEALPPRPFSRDYWLCKNFCQFRTRCWEQDGEGVEL